MPALSNSFVSWSIHLVSKGRFEPTRFSTASSALFKNKFMRPPRIVSHLPPDNADSLTSFDAERNPPQDRPQFRRI